jgi:hypothetical protein
METDDDIEDAQQFVEIRRPRLRLILRATTDPLPRKTRQLNADLP